jgi:hypothetical protein
MKKYIRFLKLESVTATAVWTTTSAFAEEVLAKAKMKIKFEWEDFGVAAAGLLDSNQAEK